MAKKIEKRLGGLEKSLSFQKWKIHSKPLHTVSHSYLFSLAKRVEKMERDSLWEGYGNGNGSYLMEMAKTRSGPGISNVEKKNRSLLAKWLWRFPLETSLCHSVIRCKDGIHPNGWDENMVRNGSNKSPRKEYPTCLSFVALEVHNGKAISFWEDKRRGDSLLCEKFPHY